MTAKKVKQKLSFLCDVPKNNNKSTGSFLLGSFFFGLSPMFQCMCVSVYIKAHDTEILLNKQIFCFYIGSFKFFIIFCFKVLFKLSLG